jgi:hypothetical protein
MSKMNDFSDEFDRRTDPCLKIEKQKEEKWGESA